MEFLNVAEPDPHVKSKLLNAETSLWTTSDHLLPFGAFTLPNVDYIANLIGTDDRDDVYEVDHFGFVNFFTSTDDENIEKRIASRTLQEVRYWLGLNPHGGILSNTELIHVQIRAREFFLMQTYEAIRDLSNIVDSMTRLTFPKLVAKLANDALADGIHASMEISDLNKSLALSINAAAKSAEALNDNTVNSDPHFSIEYMFALYAPFGLPVAVPVISGFIKYWKKRRAGELREKLE